MIRKAAGWALFLLLAYVVLRVVIASPQGTAQLVRDGNARVGTFASQLSRQLPSPRVVITVTARPSPGAAP
jgi:hypothetical protein